jgi:hypothetical protein
MKKWSKRSSVTNVEKKVAQKRRRNALYKVANLGVNGYESV